MNFWDPHKKDLANIQLWIQQTRSDDGLENNNTCVYVHDITSLKHD